MIIEHAVQQLERELSDWRSLDEVKRYLRRAGFTQKAILSDAEMERVGSLVRNDARAIETPDAELRYIEGLFGVPLGSIPSFLVIDFDYEPWFNTTGDTLDKCDPQSLEAVGRTLTRYLTLP